MNDSNEIVNNIINIILKLKFWMVFKINFLNLGAKVTALYCYI